MKSSAKCDPPCKTCVCEKKVMFYPVNRHLLVKDIPEDEEQNTVLLPDDYKVKNVREYKPMKVVRVAEDSKLKLDSGHIVIVEASMVKEVDYRGNTYNLILENYVYGAVSLL